MKMKVGSDAWAHFGINPLRGWYFRARHCPAVSRLVCAQRKTQRKYICSFTFNNSRGSLATCIWPFVGFLTNNSFIFILEGLMEAVSSMLHKICLEFAKDLKIFKSKRNAISICQCRGSSVTFGVHFSPGFWRLLSSGSESTCLGSNRDV